MTYRKQKSCSASTSHPCPVPTRTCLVKGSTRLFLRPPIKIWKSTKDISHYLSGPSKPWWPSAYKGSSLCRDSYHCDPKPPIGGAAATFSEQLEITDTVSVHFANDPGSPDSLRRTPEAVIGPLADLSQPAEKACHRAGNRRNVSERGSSGGLPPERG